MPKEILCGFGVDVDADCLHVESRGRSPLPRSDPVPRKMFDRTEGGDFARFAEHLVDFACVKLLGIEHPSGVLLNNN